MKLPNTPHHGSGDVRTDTTLVSSLVTRPGYFLVVAAVLHGVAGLVFNGEITAKTDGL